MPIPRMHPDQRSYTGSLRYSPGIYILTNIAGNPKAIVYMKYIKNSLNLIVKRFTTQDMNKHFTKEDVKMAH